MSNRSPVRFACIGAPLFVLSTLCFATSLQAQDRLKGMPRYDRYMKLRGEIGGSVKRGALAVTWQDGGKSFEFSRDGKTYRYDVATLKATETKAVANLATGNRVLAEDQAYTLQPTPYTRFLQARGRQAASASSPDSKHKAVYRDRNLYITDPDGGHEVAITTDGNEKDRVKNGTASWVYGEELYQRSAIWWSPDSRKVAFYRFDESKVPDYYLQMNNLRLQDSLDIEPYPKAGVANPIVDLLVYDLDSKKTVRVDVRDGKPFDNSVVGHYAYNVSWTPDGKELLFNRTNRRQNVMELTAADPDSGKCRVVVREEWPPSWTDNTPAMKFLKDGKRFLWRSERTGFHNLYLYDLGGKLLARLTNHAFDVERVVRVDEDANRLFYTARDGDNPHKMQVHRVALDGTGDIRITDPAFTHTVDIAPDGQHFIDTAQTHDTPPVARLLDADGKVLDELAKSDLTKFDALHLQKAELFTFKAADGKTDLYGILNKPSDFDPTQKYPVLASVYAGPETSGASENFATPNPLTELGFLTVSLDARSAEGRGKKVLDSIYLHLGVTEIDDLAAGIKALRGRPYVDGNRVGIEGTSYGGYASVLAILRYPDVFQAAYAGSPVTDFRMYDSIYTERYMWIPEENTAGYDAGSAMTYAKNLRGRLMLYYGTADNNVHPSNSLQLITALQRAGKSFEVQVGPDQGHSSVRLDRMVEFFVDNLIVRPDKLLAPAE